LNLSNVNFFSNCASPFPSFGIIKTIESWSPEYGSCRTLHAKFVFSPDVASFQRNMENKV
jgi:hypothetical protein